MNTKALRQKILDLAIHGKLVPQNPKDESATVLLEKIRAEKDEKIKQGELKADKKDSFIFVGSDKRHYEQFADGTVRDIEDEIPFDVPEGWAWCRLGEIVEVSSAKRVLQQDWKKSGIPFYRAREIAQLSNNEKVIDDLFITSQLYSELKLKYGVPIAGDLMVSAVGTIGKIYIVKDTDCFYYKDASVICFSKKEKNIDSLYLKFCCETDFLQEQMYSQSKGTTVDTITINKAQNYLIPLPPISEQKKIVDSVQKFFSHIDILEHKKSELKISIKQAKSKILDLAIRGKIVPQNPNDESAEELLKRIATSDNRPYEKVE
ncbi:restriction endonuclease subunit S, partial [Treponema pectinovorum]|uniref:restriction endonuclease subunit S n=1 Tax=Treponema pectinovorum TaxID=164 RepID=UPI00164E00D7